MDNNTIKYKIPYLDDFAFLLLDTLNNNICLDKLCYENIGEILDDFMYNADNTEIYVSPIEVKTIEIVQKYREEFGNVLQKVINEINSEYIKLKQNEKETFTK